MISTWGLAPGSSAPVPLRVTSGLAFMSWVQVDPARETRLLQELAHVEDHLRLGHVLGYALQICDAASGAFGVAPAGVHDVDAGIPSMARTNRFPCSTSKVPLRLLPGRVLLLPS